MQGSVVGGSNLSSSANTPTSPSPSPSSPLMNKPSTTTTTSPTIYVYYGSRHVKARIDQEVPLEEIIRVNSLLLSPLFSRLELTHTRMACSN